MCYTGSCEWETSGPEAGECTWPNWYTNSPGSPGLPPCPAEEEPEQEGQEGIDKECSTH